jgi:LysM repeat protein
VTVHRIRNGDTLGGIALKYGSTITMLKKAHRMRSNFLRAGQRLSVPLRGPCTHCPVPPPFLLPPRRLPPEAPVPALVAAKTEAPGASDCVKPAPADAAPVAEVAPAAEPAPAAAEPVVAKESAGGSSAGISHAR